MLGHFIYSFTQAYFITHSLFTFRLIILLTINSGPDKVFSLVKDGDGDPDLMSILPPPPGGLPLSTVFGDMDLGPPFCTKMNKADQNKKMYIGLKFKINIY